MKKKTYVRAEQKLVNIATDSVLFTNSSEEGPGDGSIGGGGGGNNSGGYSILSGFMLGSFAGSQDS